LFKEFREFAMRGNVVDLAVGVIIGAAFGAIVTSLAADIIMPIIGLITGGMDFSDLSYQLKAAALGPDGRRSRPSRSTMASSSTWSSPS